MTTPLALRARAESEAARLPPLLARAEQLAGTVLLGEHGRRRAGLGDDFWQYRPAQPGDPAHRIDWRRSGRGDQQFVREREWQIAQSVMLWVDRAASMRFSSDKGLPEKGDRARLLALALSVMLIRGGERVGLTGASLPPRRGNAQLERLAAIFMDDDASDYGEPEARGMIPHARAVFISDFMGDVAPVHAALTKAADRGVRGLLIQVLDPSEEAFPFQGRTVFESVGGTLSHETLKAGDLRDRYLQRLAARKDELAQLCRATGWQYHCHHTGDSAQAALLWAWRAMDQGAVR
ncbi:DUF58 domain-containing protein [Lutimaribacter saemankumensis]|uniref:DUF58 domain-containing protein n=1 Tax=Lutimaribacter saemankumensis TaxID=490829 RepID=A0A1G8PAX4_9RHOB|nr:DUF58 domain-containing protein [Lutimaribacter saemankumensis]SDI89711.1 Protein of unknown function DUF58 [Lutimaribacter saemankumensis]